MIQTDVLIIGGGIAGLFYAIKTSELQPASTVTLLSKDSLLYSNTRFAQGGIAAVTDREHDSEAAHIEDTLRAGDGLCERRVVEMVVKEGPALVKELMEMGASFDRKGNSFDLAREGGHSANRVLHAADHTGLEIMLTLITTARARKNIRILEHHFALDLICAGGACVGAWVAHENEKLYSIAAKVTMVATGGIGQIYRYTTNPLIASGDGLAMARRAGAKIMNMEFVQFHPTALWEEKPRGPLFLISEAVRGAGAYLLDHSGKRFMAKYDSRLELATRDTVARAVQEEISKGGKGFVYLDCRHIKRDKFLSHFPTINNRLLDRGIDAGRDLIPVVPAAHYSCGGISTGLNGETNISGLLAAGECACTGLHGANRLASNSLPEALVFANRAARLTAELLPQMVLQPANTSLDAWENRTLKFTERQVKKQIREIMSSVAICGSHAGLEYALKLAANLKGGHHNLPGKRKTSRKKVETWNMLEVAELVLQAGLVRTENRGAFYKNASVTV